jgi:hypothetical protein
VHHHHQDFSGTVIVVDKAQKLTNSQCSNSAKTLKKKNVQVFDPATGWQVDPFPRRGFDEGGLS